MTSCSTKLFVGLLLTIGLAYGTQANANTLTMEYKPFYQRLKVLYQGDYPDSNIVFRLLEAGASNAACAIESGKIFNKNYELPLVYTSESVLLIPYDRKLYSDKAVVALQTKQPCELTIALALKRPKASYDADELVKQLNQLYALMRDFAGVSKFMLPEIVGATLSFDAKSEVTLISSEAGDDVTVLVSQTDEIQLSLAQLSMANRLTMSSVPTSIRLWLAPKK
ncbi:DUF2987 domain-containing protein [Corallincola luteus]|uniref:DUF2987 domain-containing protein n=1 Tax=Corallincola luteus TaxID=1775177 RepID=A0ABY2ANE1_9GAMM|nr:DUF2987 domain-containing protein [Corallincola luteus]TCI03189.1 DUF2987 domain-containing protein [Corallincola luteus]